MIDIIVPVYNSRDTLEEMIISIVKQINIPKIIVYLIDDFSTDDYSDIIDKYKSKINIVYKKLDSNKGPGTARKIGMEMSKGKYILFLDSDDELYDKDSLSILYNTIVSSNADVVRSVIYEEYNEGIREYKNDNIGLHGKIYRRSFVNNNNISFNDKRSNEDTGFNLLIDLCGAKYVDIDDVTYLWKNNEKSITRKNKAKYELIDNQDYSYNIYWAFKEALNKTTDNQKMYYLLIVHMMEIFFRSRNIEDTKVLNVMRENGAKLYQILISIYDGFFMNLIYDFDFINMYGKENIYQMLKFVCDKPIDLTYEISPTYTEEEWKDRYEHLKIMKEFNEYPLGNSDFLNKMLASVGDYSQIIPPFNANWGGKNIHLGSGCYINFNFQAVDDGDIYIGNDTLLGPDVKIITVNHPIDPNKRLSKKMYIKDVFIEENVWIGAGTIIFPGVTIGKNSVIGAGSIVTKDIPDNVLAYGNPCKVIKKI